MKDLYFKFKHLIKPVFSTLLFLIFIGEKFAVAGQSNSTRDTVFSSERNNILRTIASMAPDTSVSYPVVRNFESQLNESIRIIDKARSIKAAEKEKLKRSLVYFVQELNSYLARKKIHLYEIDGAIASYRNALTALVKRKPLLPVLLPVGTLNSELIAAAFTQFKEQALLEDIATYKRIADSPEFIYQFLRTKPGFRFSDSLLMDAMVNDPNKMLYFLKNEDAVLKQHIGQSTNKYIRQVAALSNSKNAPELTLFTPQLLEGKISAEEVVRTRTEPLKYFQLLVNTMLDVNSHGSTRFHPTLDKGIREKAMAFYVNDINNLHDAAEQTRFASVRALRPQDLYFILTSAGEELYTSSYLGLYKRLIAQFSDQPVDSLLDLVQWKNFRVFIRMAANYNVLDDFFRKLSPAKLREVLALLISHIETDQDNALEKAMDIADSFGALTGSPETLDLMAAEIFENYQRCNLKRDFLGMRLYSILGDLLKSNRQKNGLEKLWSVLGDYETLKHSSLENEKGGISELVLFYGDEDGVASFTNFLKNYTDKTRWEVSRNDHWVNIRSVKSHPMTIYANLPLSIRDGADIGAQDKLFTHLKANSLEPTIIVHRGHSYHLDKTLKRLTSSVKLTILGSCGGYNKSISIASINPDVQVIGSKQTGSKAINDPILDMINEQLSNGQDLYWPEIWKKLGDRFRKDPAMLAVFNEYFPPSHNLGLFVLKLYQSNKRLL